MTFIQHPHHDKRVHYFDLRPNTRVTNYIPINFSWTLRLLL